MASGDSHCRIRYRSFPVVGILEPIHSRDDRIPIVLASGTFLRMSITSALIWLKIGAGVVTIQNRLLRSSKKYEFVSFAPTANADSTAKSSLTPPHCSDFALSPE